jgi:hypothetical protein
MDVRLFRSAAAVFRADPLADPLEELGRIVRWCRRRPELSFAHADNIGAMEGEVQIWVARRKQRELRPEVLREPHGRLLGPEKVVRLFLLARPLERREVLLEHFGSEPAADRNFFVFAHAAADLVLGDAEDDEANLVHVTSCDRAVVVPEEAVAEGVVDGDERGAVLQVGVDPVERLAVGALPLGRRETVPSPQCLACLDRVEGDDPRAVPGGEAAGERRLAGESRAAEEQEQAGAILDSVGTNRHGGSSIAGMAKFLLWLILLVVCWPLALLALVLYPIVWVVLLPFRLLGIAVDVVFETLRAILLLPARVLRGPRT